MLFQKSYLPIGGDENENHSTITMRKINKIEK